MVPAGGTLHFSDGSPVKGITDTVLHFHRQDPPADWKREVMANYDPETGKFVVFTDMTKHAGAPAGRYKVTITAVKDYPAPSPQEGTVVDLKYTSPRSTPLEVEIAPGKENHWQWRIERAPAVVDDESTPDTDDATAGSEEPTADADRSHEGPGGDG